MADQHRALQELAHLVGVETGYWEVDGTEHVASPEALVSILRALGIDIDAPGRAEEVLRRTWASLWRMPLEPCAAARLGAPVVLLLRVPAAAGGPLLAVIELEDGGERRLEVDLGAAPVLRGDRVEGEDRVERRIELAVDLPAGYHRVRLEGQGVTAAAHLLVAPTRAYGAPGELRTWGVFAPVHALRAPGQLGVGDLGDLAEVARQVRARGGSLLGTLPLLPCFYDRPHHNPSPYSPVSRLFWNELYIDLSPAAWRRLAVPGAEAIVRDPALAAEAAPLAGLPLVDYRRASAIRRGVLDRLAAAAAADPGMRARVEAFAAARPRVDDYARFRAHTEATGQAWGSWPEAERDGDLSGARIDEAARFTHVFAQFVLHQQLAELKAREDAAGLYLDLPVGVESAGYDLWRDRGSFAAGIAVGAPPDPLCRGGQNWAVPPLHPVRQREDGYRYLRDCIRAHMEHAAMLRIDHVMGLHRLFWIPDGGGAADGVYVRYPAEELYSILCIESHRQRCAVAGEDLGTVPEGVRPMMDERGLHGLFVGQFEWHWHEGTAHVNTPRPGAVASLDTHDTATFAAFAEREGIADPAAVMRRWTENLAAGPADVVLLTLEDLWLEREPQNVPGTHGEETANWRRRMKLEVAELATDPRVTGLLDRVAGLRPADGPR